MFLNYSFKTLIAYIFAAFAGSQMVHLYYRPMSNFSAMVEEEIERLRAEKVAK